MMNLKKNKIRWIDILGIGVFFFVLVSVAVLLRRSANYLTLVIKISPYESMDDYSGLMPQWYLQSLKPGMKQYNNSGQLEMELLKVYSQDRNEKNKEYFLTMKLLTTYEGKSNIHSYQGLPVLIGSYQTFKFNGVLIKGMVVKLGGDNYPATNKKFLVDGFLYPNIINNQDPFPANMISNGVFNYLANKFEAGKEMKDSDGQVIVKIKEAKLLPASRKFVDGGRVVEVVDPERKQVRLKLEIVAEKMGEVYVFQGLTPIKINNDLTLDFGDFGAKMTITDFKQID